MEFRALLRFRERHSPGAAGRCLLSSGTRLHHTYALGSARYAELDRPLTQEFRYHEEWSCGILMLDLMFSGGGVQIYKVAQRYQSPEGRWRHVAPLLKEVRAFFHASAK